MRHTLAAPDTMVSLTQTRHAPVVTHKESLPLFAVFWILLVGRHISLTNHLVIMYEHAGNINAVRARHTVIALITGNILLIVDILRNLQQELILLLGDRLQRRISTYILPQMFHIGHTRQDGKHLLWRSRIAESPRGHTAFGTALLHLSYHRVRHIGQTTA